MFELFLQKLMAPIKGDMRFTPGIALEPGQLTHKRSCAQHTPCAQRRRLVFLGVPFGMILLFIT
jgi:hypothetical protein